MCWSCVLFVCVCCSSVFHMCLSCVDVFIGVSICFVICFHSWPCGCFMCRAALEACHRSEAQPRHPMSHTPGASPLLTVASARASGTFRVRTMTFNTSHRSVIHSRKDLTDTPHAEVSGTRPRCNLARPFAPSSCGGGRHRHFCGHNSACQWVVGHPHAITHSAWAL